MDSEKFENVNVKNNNLKIIVSEANTVVSDDSENGSYDNGLNFSCNNLDSTSINNNDTSCLPVVRFNNSKSPQSPSQLVEINFKDVNLNEDSHNVSFIFKF
jgi:hypothetical protein